MGHFRRHSGRICALVVLCWFGTSTGAALALHLASQHHHEPCQRPHQDQNPTTDCKVCQALVANRSLAPLVGMAPATNLSPIHPGDWVRPVREAPVLQICDSPIRSRAPPQR